MRRHRRLLVLALVVVGVLVWLRLTAPRPTIVEQRAPPAVVEPRRSPLQADAEGHYVPAYRFAVNRFRFTGFSLRPEAVVTFAEGSSGTEQGMGCSEALIRPDTVHLRCDDPQIGTVTIDGKFLTRLVTQRLDAAVLTAVVTVRAGSGEILYSARESFEWHPGD